MRRTETVVPQARHGVFLKREAEWRNTMRSMLLSYGTAATALAAATFFAPPPAQAMTLATPAGLSAAIQEANVTQQVWCCRSYSYAYWPYYAYTYRPYYYAYAYRPYYTYSYAYTYRPWYYTYAYRPYYTYAYRPYYAYAYRPYYTYAYRPYYAYAYRPYRAYAYAGYGRRLWVGWGRRWW